MIFKFIIDVTREFKNNIIMYLKIKSISVFIYLKWYEFSFLT